MIFQNFNKGGTERVNYGLYEYVPGADIIFDFGNPTCTQAFNSSRIVYNVGSANVTGSLVAYNNPGPKYPTLVSAQYGTMVTEWGGLNHGSYLQWDWKATENQTNIFIYRLNGGQYSPGIYGSPLSVGTNSITTQGNTFNYTKFVDSSGTEYAPFNFSVPTSTSNGRNGYNVITVAADNSSKHYYYQNTTLTGYDTTTITRTTENKTSYLGYESNFGYLGFLQYPFILTPKQIRQTYKCFDQRFFVS